MGGKEFRRNGISKHLIGQHQADLEKTSLNNGLICDLLKSLDKKICSGCRTITKRFTALGLCNKCDKSRPSASKVILDLTTSQREESTARLMNIQETKFTLRRAVPRKLRTVCSDLFTDIALSMADATKESQARKA